MRALTALILRALPIIVMAAWPSSAQAGVEPYMEIGIDRKGSDYRDLDLPSADPAECMRMCFAEEQCRGWTFVKPGVQGPQARCWLKNKYTTPERDHCCISGYRLAGSTEPGGQGEPPPPPPPPGNDLSGIEGEWIGEGLGDIVITRDGSVWRMQTSYFKDGWTSYSGFDDTGQGTFKMANDDRPEYGGTVRAVRQGPDTLEFSFTFNRDGNTWIRTAQRRR